MRRFVTLALFGLLAGVSVAVALLLGAQREVPSTRVVSTGKALVGGPFSLVDQTGRRVTEKDFAGRYLLVFFGFTNCPDVCPAGLQVVTAALDKLGAKADRVTPIFITVDPERDTPERLAAYVKSFHPRLVGLTGTPDEIASVARAYKVYVKKVEDPASDAVTFDHSSFTYLMSPAGDFVTHFPAGTTADKMAEQVRAIL